MSIPGYDEEILSSLPDLDYGWRVTLNKGTPEMRVSRMYPSRPYRIEEIFLTMEGDTVTVSTQIAYDRKPPKEADFMLLYDIPSVSGQLRSMSASLDGLEQRIALGFAQALQSFYDSAPKPN